MSLFFEQITDNSRISLYHSDVLDALSSMPEKTADLIFADPPFNLNKEYEKELDPEEYYSWCAKWISEGWRVLKDNGTFFLMTAQHHVGRMMLSLENKGFYRNLIIWHNSSMPVKNKFCIGYQPILYYVANEKKFTFNYGVEKRESKVVLPWGRKNKAHSIKDIWDDIPFVSGGCMASSEAILIPGTKKKAHPCQMPIKLADRVVKYCSNPGDTVIDMFAGSGTMLVSCRKLNRNIIGIEASREYCKNIALRLNASIETGETVEDNGDDYD